MPRARDHHEASTGDDPGDDAEEDALDEDALDEDAEPTPLVAEGPVGAWLVLAAVPFALLCLSWLAGAPQLAIPVPTADGGSVVPELAPGERLEGLARMLVVGPVAVGATALGAMGVAFVRRRPLGHPPTLVAKCAAVVALALLLGLVPSDERMVKQALNLLGVPIAAGLLAVPVLRLSIRDAGVFLLVSSTALAGLVLGAWAVVWATG
jgi:hypothetical protein